MVTALSMETYVKVYGGCDCSYIEPVSMNSTSVVPSLSSNKVYYSTGLGLGLITGGAASMFAALYSNVVQGGPPGAFMRYTPNFYCALGLILVGSAVEVVVGARGVWY